MPLSHPSAAVLRRAGVGYSGVSDLVPGYDNSIRELDRHMVIWTFGGNGFLETVDQSMSLTANTLLVAPAGKAVHFGVDGASWQIAWHYLDNIPRWSPLKSGLRLSRTPPGVNLPHAMEGYLSATDTRHASPAARTMKAAELYAELVVLYLDDCLGRVEHQDDHAHVLAQVWQQVAAAPAREWSVALMAEIAGLSVATMHRQVKKHWQCSPWQMVRRLRMEEAKTLLRHSDYPIKIVADRVGYGSPYIFSAAFKEMWGMSPRDYRRQSS